MTYFWLNAVVFALLLPVVGFAARSWRSKGVLTLAIRRVVITAGVLVVLTAIFDNVMIAAGLFEFGGGTVTGIAIGLAPIEDFAYPIAAAVLLPCVWELLGGAGRERAGHGGADS